MIVSTHSFASLVFTGDTGNSNGLPEPVNLFFFQQGEKFPVPPKMCLDSGAARANSIAVSFAQEPGDATNMGRSFRAVKNKVASSSNFRHVYIQSEPLQRSCSDASFPLWTR